MIEWIKMTNCFQATVKNTVFTIRRYGKEWELSMREPNGSTYQTFEHIIDALRMAHYWASSVEMLAVMQTIIDGLPEVPDEDEEDSEAGNE
jgi:hypothetical protein